MKQQFYDAIVDGPIIAAVKDETGVEVCIQNDIRVVFILYGELITIPDIVQRLKDAGKFVIVHLDLIGGLAVREEAVRFIRYGTAADGIISTKPEMIRYAKELDLCTVFRIFAIDSKAIAGLEHHGMEFADLIEVLPGIMPKIIKHIAGQAAVPVIAGGLISEEGGRQAGTGCGSDCDFNDKPGSVENVTDTVYQEKGVRVCVIQLRKKLRIVSGS